MSAVAFAPQPVAAPTNPFAPGDRVWLTDAALSAMRPQARESYGVGAEVVRVGPRNACLLHVRFDGRAGTECWHFAKFEYAGPGGVPVVGAGVNQAVPPKGAGTK